MVIRIVNNPDKVKLRNFMGHSVSNRYLSQLIQAKLN